MTEKKGYVVSYYEETEMYDVSWSLNKIQVSNVITYVHLTYWIEIICASEFDILK